MTNLRDLHLETSYHKGVDDIASEFYLPCMARAVTYDRAVGFFSSTIYSLAWASLKQFVEHQGKMRIICSPALSDTDVMALEEGYGARVEEATASKLLREIKDLLASETLKDSTRVLASLVALKVIELKVAFISRATSQDGKRIFHDKLGVFKDAERNIVVFKGSMNETWLGLANDGNLESIDVFLSWESQRELERVTKQTTIFDLLWDNQYPTVTIRPFPEVAKAELLKSAAEDWQVFVDRTSQKIIDSKTVPEDQKSNQRAPRPHQLNALKAWAEHNRRGIFEHATGSGKTFTALCAINESLSKGEVVLVLVPSELLLYQWVEEIRSTLGDLAPSILICGGGNTQWRQDKLLSVWTRNKTSERHRLVVSTLQTAASEDFRNLLMQGSHLFIVVDEVHRIGSPENRKLLSIDSGPRLGLSATPRRARDQEGTDALFDYFEGVIPPPFTLKDAIGSVLTPYFYYVHTIRLTEDEQANWDKITDRVSKLFARIQTANDPNEKLNNSLKMLLIERARILKAAQNKVEMALNVIRNNYEPGQRWIVYCDALSQLREVNNILKQQNFPVVEYHSSMEGDRKKTIAWFETNGGILVSIKCLDEGVDIPAVTHALILASSKNPREFIQRRGRVLRKAPNKHLAYIHDVLVLPTNSDDSNANSIIAPEIARAIEFGKWGQNPSSINDLERIALEFGIDYQSITNEGYEDDDN